MLDVVDEIVDAFKTIHEDERVMGEDVVCVGLQGGWHMVMLGVY
jgi:hypothetical protein